MIKSDKFLADVKKLKFNLVPASGKEMDKIVSKTLNVDKATLAKAEQFYAGLRTGVVKKKKKK